MVVMKLIIVYKISQLIILSEDKFFICQLVIRWTYLILYNWLELQHFYTKNKKSVIPNHKTPSDIVWSP